MKFKHTLATLLALVILASCGNSSEESTTEKVAPTATTASLTDTVPAAPASTEPASVIHPPLNPAAPAITPGTKLNPAHGQPGHRCEIAVGAPLDSKPAPAATATVPNVTIDPFAKTQPKNAPGVTVTPSAQIPPVTTAKTSSAGLNPAHGQPGHRCDIAVGAPLDSKPTVTTQSLPLTASDEIKATPIVTPAAPAPSPVAKTVTAPGMNPPHGEPGHRCDISVGAPLNSPPKKN